MASQPSSKPAPKSVAPSSITPELLAQLNEQGFTLDINGQLVALKPEDKPSAVVRVLREGASDGADLGKTVVKGTGTVVSTVVENAAYYGVDVPAEGIKATVRGVGRLHGAIVSGHENRMATKRKRRETKRIEREAREQAEAKAEAEAKQAEVIEVPSTETA